MKFQMLIAACVLTLAGCSTPPSGPDGQSASASICSRETPTGTSIAATRCRTKDQIERDAKAVQEIQDGIGRTRIAPKSSGV